jgi:hypothetical protein
MTMSVGSTTNTSVQVAPLESQAPCQMCFRRGTIAIVCFQGFPLLRERKRLFDFASVRHMTRQQEFFGAIPRGFSHLEADRDHDWT